MGRRIAWALALSLSTAAGCQHAQTNVRDTSANAPAQADVLAANTAPLQAIVGLETVEEDIALAPVGEPRTVGGFSGGTGVVVDAAGLILTNAHVVEQARAITVVLADGTRCAARTVAANVHQDLAIVQIDRTNLPALMPIPHAPRVRQPVVAVGRPPGSPALLLRQGVITRRVASLQAELDPAGLSDYSRLIESTAQIEPGFSGGPLLDQRGRLVGINVAVAEYTDGTFGYALRFDDAAVACVQRLIREASAVAHAAPFMDFEPLIRLD